LPYAQQLKQKLESATSIIKSIDETVKEPFIVASPLESSYRNNATFSVGFSEQGNVCVGFTEGNYKKEPRIYAPDDSLCPPVALELREKAESFVRSSELPVFTVTNGSGITRASTALPWRSFA
jgi:tRNA/tmRNA/rRNA uracil-C5-methylase (TrmA/RlmC/RlmD family)